LTKWALVAKPGTVTSGLTASLRIATTLLVWALASACGPNDDVGGTSDDSLVVAEKAGTVEVAAGALDEAVAIGLPQLPRKFDPLDDLEPWAMRVADDLLFEGLVRRTQDAYPWAEPAIADRCEVDREYAVASITCHIPRGVRFHDGSELQVEDVIYSLTYWLDPRRGWIRARHGLSNFKSVAIVDAPRGADQRDPGRWVQITLDKREPLALEALAAVKIVPRNAHRGQETRFAQHPIGTGPMRMASLGQDRIVLERFAEYRDSTRAAMAGKIVIRAIADGAEALTALRRGELHLLPELSPVHIPVELGKPGMSGRFTAWLVSPPHYDLLLWNLGAGAQEHLPLRQALHDALPLSALTREVYGAPGLPIAAPVDLHEPTAIDLDALEGSVRGFLSSATSASQDEEQCGCEGGGHSKSHRNSFHCVRPGIRPDLSFVYKSNA
jgi:ABC-type transport system substrate-binding protein